MPPKEIHPRIGINESTQIMWAVLI